jgi:hypothetical protein
VYGGLQDNGNWGGPSNSRDVNGILNDHWFKFHSGDGFHTTVDPNDWRTVYTESQGGSVRRLDAVFRQMGRSITPTPATILNYAEYAPPRAQEGQGGRGGGRGGLPPSFRFNWSAALTLSPHDSRTVYLGANHLFKSVDRGDTWTIVSPDLTTNDPAKTARESGGLTRDASGAETHCTIITIAESPITPGLIWVGTDDGNVQVTRNGGATWTNVRANIPEAPNGIWVSRVEASRFAEGTAYVSFDGHRSDEFRPWIFRTTDYGRSWTKISGALPAGDPVYVVEEGTKNPKLLFAGTEFGAYATVDGGATWHRLSNGLPTVPVHDLVIHPRDGDLVAATHGRSVFVLDDISALEQLTDEAIAADAHLFQSRLATIWRGVSRGATRGHMLFMGRNPLTIDQRPPGNSPPELQNSAAIHYYLRSDQAAPVTLEIRETDGPGVHRAAVPGTAGIHRYYWDLRFGSAPGTSSTPASAGANGGDDQDQPAQAGRGRGRGRGGRGGGPPAGPGTYLVTLNVGGKTLRSVLTVRDDPGIGKLGSW